MTNLVTQPDATVGTSNWSGTNFSTDGAWFKGQQPTSGSIHDVNLNYAYVLNITGGTVYTALADVQSSKNYAQSTGVTMYIRWDDANGQWISTTSTRSWTVPVSSTTTRIGGETTAPAGAVRAYVTFTLDMDRLANGWLKVTNFYLGQYVSGGGAGSTPPPPPPEVETGLDVALEIEDTTKPGNLISNPSGEIGAAGWVSNVASAIVTTTGTAPWTHLKMTAMQQAATWYTSDVFPIDPTLDYTGLRIVWGGFSADTRIGISVEWLDASQNYLGTTAEEVVTPVSAAEYNKVVGGYSIGTAYARLKIRQYHYTGTNDNPWVNDYFEFREATAVQSDVLSEVENLESWQAESTVWINVIQPTHEISIERDSVDVGLMAATILNEEYDPAAGGIVTPGAAVRMMVLADNVWTSIFTGHITNARTDYPRSGTRIYLTASDHMTLLSNQNEPEGVATIAGLPYILADKGVSWSANGNANQVGAQTIVSTNDNASVFDQMVITRDSDKGYVWVDANNVVQMWNRSLMPTTPAVEFSDVANAASNYDSYSHIDIGFDTRQTINVVEIIYLRYSGGTTTEVKYGPYIDADSVKKWGAYKSTFTIHGITESAANMQAFANDVLAKNATPTIRPNGITVPIKDERARAHAAAIDLYTMVGVKYSDKYDGDLRVTSIRHAITPDKWVAEYTFEKGDSVAIPVWTPSVNRV